MRRGLLLVAFGCGRLGFSAAADGGQDAGRDVPFDVGDGEADADGDDGVLDGDATDGDGGCVGAGCGPLAGLAAGGSHTCAWRTTGELYCWGRNDRGQLGLGDRVTRAGAARVPGVAVRMAAAGGETTCAVLLDGTAACWGENVWGQLGDGTTLARAFPAPVLEGAAPLAGVELVAVGDSFACAVADGGTRVLCWGSNLRGELGIGTHGDGAQTTATLASAPAGVEALALGGAHACLLTTGRDVYCWGWNSAGETGADPLAVQTTDVPTRLSWTARSLPVAVTITRLSSHALAADGSVWGWGENGAGVLGDSWATEGGPEPVRAMLAGGEVAVSLDCGGARCCARVEGDPVPRCWGSGQQYEQNTLENWHVGAPTPSPVGRGGERFAVGPVHACALRDDQRVACWGQNGYGELGTGVRRALGVPTRIALPAEPTALAVGYHDTCVVATTGEVWCWGENLAWTAGLADVTAALTPNRVDLVGGRMVRVSVGGAHACALDVAGGVRCWGQDWGGQLGDGVPGVGSASGVVVPGLADVTGLAAGAYASCAISGGDVLCWGDDAAGQATGLPTEAGLVATPVLVGRSAFEVRTTHWGACAALASGAVSCWGRNSAGILGAGVALGVPSPPIDLPVVADVASLAVGESHACAAERSGALWCWGSSKYGALGLGSSTRVLDPTPVALDDVERVAAGADHTCAIAGARELYCWGRGHAGQLGDGAFADRTTPPSAPVLEHVLDVSAGNEHTCALVDTDGDGLGLELYCFGTCVMGRCADGVPDRVDPDSPPTVVGLD